LIVEVHPEPEQAWSDGRQTMTFDAFATMMQEVSRVAQAVGRSVASTPPTANETSA
jgi:3-deoxy-7-phosphoheptulonate synthase